MTQSRGWLPAVGILVIAVLLLAACGGAAPTAAPTPMPVEEESSEDEHMEDEHMEDEHEEGDEHAEDEHEEGDEHVEDEHMDEHSPEEHMEGGHDVPDEAAAVKNPVEADEASVAAGAELYATNCAVCHGESGEGDGPTAASLDPAPADLHEDHVQGISDGALFYIISHGTPEKAMPAWEGTLDEEQRWHVVNFLRTFQE